MWADHAPAEMSGELGVVRIGRTGGCAQARRGEDCDGGDEQERDEASCFAAGLRRHAAAGADQSGDAAFELTPAGDDSDGSVHRADAYEKLGEVKQSLAVA